MRSTRKKHKNQHPESPASDLVYGHWPVRVALESGPVAKIYFYRELKRQNIEDIVHLAQEKKVPFQWVDRRKLDRMVRGNHQGIVAQVTPFSYMSLDQVLSISLKSPRLGPSLLFLDGIQDPQNLGSILRSAAYFGVSGVVIPKWRAAPVSSVAIKTSAGAARLIPVAQVSNLAESMERAREQGVWLVGADISGKPVRTTEVPRPFGLVLGSEGEGLHELVRKKCDLLVRIDPAKLLPGIDSLNVSAAAAVLMYQFS